MKPSILVTAAIATITLLGATALAEARPHRGHHASHVYVSGYRSCGTPIYSERYLVRYMRCGSPVWGYRVVAPPRYCSPPRRYYQRPVCPPPYPYPGGYYRSRVVIGGNLRL